MSKMKFDLCSDLHIDFWDVSEQIKWDGLSTSLVAVVAGDISYDIEKSYRTIVDISKHYRHVIFVDGNHEHSNQIDFQNHNMNLRNRLKKYQNISFLNRNAVIIDGTAFVGANGWWSFDFCEPDIAKDEAYFYFAMSDEYTEVFLQEVYYTAKEDARVLCEIIAKLTVESAVEKIVVITHTSPNQNFIEKTNLQSNVHYGRCGSSFLKNIIDYDINCKISTWCFGHVHKEIDTVIDGIRYVCHPRGRKDDCPQNIIYYPKLIDIS
jgi:Icc-related predicted phosphoesterase